MNSWDMKVSKVNTDTPNALLYVNIMYMFISITL